MKMWTEYLALLKNGYFNNHKLLKNIIQSYHLPKVIASLKFSSKANSGNISDD